MRANTSHIFFSLSPNGSNFQVWTSTCVTHFWYSDDPYLRIDFFFSSRRTIICICHQTDPNLEPQFLMLWPIFENWWFSFHYPYNDEICSILICFVLRLTDPHLIILLSHLIFQSSALCLFWLTDPYLTIVLTSQVHSRCVDEKNYQNLTPPSPHPFHSIVLPIFFRWSFRNVTWIIILR